MRRVIQAITCILSAQQGGSWSCQNNEMPFCDKTNWNGRGKGRLTNVVVIASFKLPELQFIINLLRNAFGWPGIFNLSIHCRFLYIYSIQNNHPLEKNCQRNLGIGGDLQCKELNLGQDTTWEMENNLRERGWTGKHKGGMEMSWLDKEKAWIEKKGFGSCTAVWKMRGNWGGWAVLEGRSWTPVIGVMRSDEKGWILTGGQSGHLPNDMHCNDLP